MPVWLLFAPVLVRLWWECWKCKENQRCWKGSHCNQTFVEVGRRTNQWWSGRVTQKLWGIISKLYVFQAFADSISAQSDATNYFLLVSFILSERSAGRRVWALPVTWADARGLQSLSSCLQWLKFLLGLSLEESVTPPLCISKHPAVLPRSMPSLQMCSAVRSSGALIFDVSYGRSVVCKLKQRQRFKKSTSIKTSRNHNERDTRMFQILGGFLGCKWGWNSENVHQTCGVFVLPSCPLTNKNNPRPLPQTCFGEPVHNERAFALSSHTEHFM